jgi:hypothetical protein
MASGTTFSKVSVAHALVICLWKDDKGKTVEHRNIVFGGCHD